MFSFSRVSFQPVATSSSIKIAQANPVFRLAHLRAKTLKQAGKFHDYNFRIYFLAKTVDVYNAMAKQPEAKIAEFCAGEGKEQYLQMKRMSSLNSTYSRTPVFLDPQFSSATSQNPASVKSNEASLPRRAFASEEDE